MTVLVERPAVEQAQLVHELKTLRKGRGIHASQIDERVGSGLRLISGVAADDGPVAIRVKVETYLEVLARYLPADLRAAALIAFAIAPDSRHPLYKDRVTLAAARIHRDPRTARRRIDEAIERLAELAVAPDRPLGVPVAAISTGWHHTALVLTVALDHPQPELIERCLLTSDQDGLREVSVLTDQVLGGSSTGIDVFYGGSPTGSRGTVLVLPRPLAYGESHEYTVRCRMEAGTAPRSRIEFTPTCRCDELDLHVRFGRYGVPAGLRRMGDEHTREWPDGAGELHLHFDALIPGRTYGLQWDRRTP